MSHSISNSSARDKRRQARNEARAEVREQRAEARAEAREHRFEKRRSELQAPHRHNLFGGWRRYLSLDILKVFAGFVLLVSLSWEIIAGDHRYFSPLYLWIQLLVCIVFLCDFFIRWGLAGEGHRNRFFWEHLLYLLISIPWLNIFVWSGIPLTHDWGLLVGLIPMLRAFLAMNIIVQWIVRQKNRVACLFGAYIFTVVVFTYLSALVFYDYEVGVNTKLDGFGNALWWAWMNVTTVGAEIFAVTTIGKIVTILLPSLGMMFFPIFTTYILDRYTGKAGQA